MTNEQSTRLEYPFRPNEIEWRILRTSKDKTQGVAAAYVDSRAIQRRLDAVVGRENWQNHFNTVAGKDNSSTTHICEISIFYSERNEWITKSNGAGNTDFEAVKGGLSNAFKRAASMWGIGRYLYELGEVWVLLKDGKYIIESEYTKLNKAYNDFLKQYLAKKQNGGQAQSNESTKQVQPTTVSTGRFATAGANKQPSNGSFKIVNLQTSNGANQTTMITFTTPDYQNVTGYIKGGTDLKVGQSIRDVKIVEKEDPVVGKYNIITDYQVA